MAVLLMMFKILFLLFLTSFFFILYFLLRSTLLVSPIIENNYRYHSKDDHKNHEFITASAKAKVIPMPEVINFGASTLVLSDGFYIRSNQKPTKDLQSAIDRYSKYISLLTEFSVKNNEDASPSVNSLIIDCPSIRLKKNKYPNLDEDESYTLSITNKGIYLHSDTLTGIIRGLSTFIQLIEKDTTTNKVSVPYINIIDRPRFSWRGLMLDVCRHWLPMSVITRTLDAMELSKLNVLHLHLSDDQGFRVESVRYPLLHDRKDYFSQKDIQYIIEYARQRRIRIVPEFDIPGHTTSWFIGYPDLASRPGPYQVETRWGVMQATMDPTRESTYTFLDGFFKEMTELFPDPYFHIGGDEVEGTQWGNSESIRKFIQEHQLVNKNGLQAYFNKRIQPMLQKYGKIMIGWEEIIEELNEKLAMSPDAVIHSWKSRESLFKAINKGYRGLLSNGYYLDYLEPSIKHYQVDPIREDEANSLDKKQQARILGGEACMWTEFVSENNVDSRLWPRTIAIAERFWSPSSMNNENFLYERLFRMNHLLDKIQIGLTHISSYKQRLQNLIINPNKKTSLLHPLVILADVCEPGGNGERSSTGRYTSTVPLTTFVDALQAESEVVWKLKQLPINDEKLRDTFQMWSLNHVRLQQLFEEVDMSKSRQLWGQDIEQLSKNLAQVGQVGLRILDYKTKGTLHHDKTDSMNKWPLPQWITHHQTVLAGLEIQVNEVRLAAVRPVRRLLDLVQSNA